jgi:protein CpxP
MGLRAFALGRLDLSDEQRTKVRAIMDAHQEELRSIGERQRTASQALRQAETAETLDEGLVRVRAAELAAVEADAAVARARLHAEVFQVLTPEQQTRAREMQSRMEERAGAARERMRR